MIKYGNMGNPFSLEGKKILITGASSGIGMGVALECAKMGASLILTGRNIEKLNQIKSEIGIDNVKVVVADLSKIEDVTSLADNVLSIDGLVNCAGIIKSLPFKFFTPGYIDEIMNVNFKSGVYLTSILIKQKKIPKRSSIVFISSISGNLVTSTANSLYGASKAAINGVVKGMALELSNQQIRVNTIMPGIVKTRLLSDIPMNEDQLSIDMKKYPLGYGEVSDVAYACVYLLSDASKWMTGSSLLLDGGYTLM